MMFKTINDFVRGMLGLHARDASPPSPDGSKPLWTLADLPSTRGLFDRGNDRIQDRVEAQIRFARKVSAEIGGDR